MNYVYGSQNHCVDSVYDYVFHFFQNLNLGKPQPKTNGIWQSIGLDLANLNVYANFHHHVPHSSRDRAIFTFLEFGLRHSLDRWKCLFAIPWARSCQYQCACKIISKYSKRFNSYGHVHTQLHKLTREKQLKSSEFGPRHIASTDENCHFAIHLARSCQYQCVCKKVSKYSKRFKSYGHYSQTDRGRTHRVIRKSTFSFSVGRLSPDRAILCLCSMDIFYIVKVPR